MIAAGEIRVADAEERFVGEGAHPFVHVHEFLSAKIQTRGGKGEGFTLTSSSLDLRTQELMDVDEWMRAFAYESLLGVGDAYFTGGNHHNPRLYVRPEDQKVLAMPWDWDSSYFNAPNASLVGGANLAKIVNLPNNLRAYYGHLYELVRTTFNSTYIARWTQHYGALADQDFSGI